MSKLVPITGTVIEVGNSTLSQHWTEYGSVHIRESDGRITQIKQAFVSADLPNALSLDSSGTFYFRKVLAWGGSRQMLAAHADGGRLRTASIGGGAPFYALMALMSVVLIPIMIGMITLPFCLAAAVSHARAQRDIDALRRDPPSGSEVLHVRTI